jgi:hypothetical protein
MLPPPPPPALAPVPAPVPIPAPAARNSRGPSADTPEPRNSTPNPSLKFKMPAPIVKTEPAASPMAPPPVPPRKISFAVPTKKRARDADDILADEVDAMTAPTSQAQTPMTVKPHKKKDAPASEAAGGVTKKARRSKSKSPEKQSQLPAPTQVKKKKRDDKELDAYLAESPASVPETPPPPPVTMATPVNGNPFANDLPPSKSAGTMPFRMKRAKALVAILQKEPSAVWVSFVLLHWFE